MKMSRLNRGVHVLRGYTAKVTNVHVFLCMNNCISFYKAI